MPLLIVFLIAALFATDALAEPTPLFSTTVETEVFGIATTVPVKITADAPDDAAMPLRILGEAWIAGLLPVAARALEQEVAAHHKGCEERWSAWDGDVSAEGGPARGGALVARLTVRAELWECNNLFKTRLGRETATLHAALRPHVVNQRLQIQLDSFSMSGLGSISAALGVETAVRLALQNKIGELNNDPAFFNPPPELAASGYAYESAGVGTIEGKGPILSIVYAGPNNTLALLQLTSKLLERLEKP